MRITLRFIFYKLIVIISLIILIEFKNNFNDDYSNSYQDETFNPIESSNNNCDWEYIKPRAYFKRSLSFYFWDVSLINLSYVTMKKLDESFYLIIKILNKKRKIILKTRIKKYKKQFIKPDPFNGDYNYYKIMAQFDLQKYLIKYDWKMSDIDLTVQITNIKGKNSHSNI